MSVEGIEFPGEPTRPVAEAMRYGSAMLRRFGWFFSLLGLGRALGRLRLEDHSTEQIRAASLKGPVVYVLPRRSTIDYLALNVVLNERRLPLSAWAAGVTSFWWQPIAEAWRDLVRRSQERLRRGSPPDPVESGWLARTVAEGVPVTVFVDNPTALVDLVAGDPGDPLRAILDAQERCPTPIQLVPVLIVWSRAPELDYGAVQWFLDGIREAPGFLGQLWRAWRNSPEAFVQIGQPIDLQAFAQRFDAPRRPKALRLALRRYLHREETLVRGPRLLPHATMRRIVLDNPPMRELARREAEAQGVAVEKVSAQLVKEYNRVAADFKWWVIRLLHLVLQPLWTRIYAGVDVRPEDMERIRAAMRGGTVVLIPSHKSHFDYLLISWVFYVNDLIVPHVVAGMNLAIWPVSILLRGAGGFFVKRSFSGDRLFPAVFSRYLRELVRQGYPVEFFIEGGRTRSGKLMPPKLGVLGMILEASEVRRTGREVTLLPVSLAYEQVAEEAAYARELGGERKTAESVSELVKARSVLWRRYGRVYMRTGEPILCGPIVDAPAGGAPWTERSTLDRKEALQVVGERVIHRIGRVTVTLPTSIVALALLAHHRRGLAHSELVGRLERFRALLVFLGAPEAASLAQPSHAWHEALARFLRARLVESLEHPKEQVWAVVVDKRITLDFHKNQVLHFLAPAMFATAAIRALPDGPFAAADLLGSFAYLAFVLRREFVLDPDRSCAEQLEDGLKALLSHGAVAQEGPLWRVADVGRIAELHGLLRSVLEGYLFVVQAAGDLARGTGLDALPRAMQVAGEQDGRGVITRPESLSLVTLQNAVGSLRDDGTLAVEDERTVLREALVAHHLRCLRPMVA